MSINKESSTVIAAFDFDGTITYRDTLGEFLRFLLGPSSLLLKATLHSPVFLGYGLGLVSRQDVKEGFLKKCIGGKAYAEIQAKAKIFCSSSLNRLIKPAALQRIHWHLSQGHQCILVSAALDTYLIPWAKKIGFTSVLSSELEVNAEGIVSGCLKGKNCWGLEKTRRLFAQFGPKENYTLYAYGDSLGDRELLNLADFAFYRSFNP